MAREQISIEDLLKTAEALSSASATIREAAEQAKVAGLPAALLHWSTIQRVYLPKILDWSVMVDRDIAMQVHAFRGKRRSAAESQKQAYAARVAAEKAKEKESAATGRGQKKGGSPKRRGSG
jgi:hypothetical protein